MKILTLLCLLMLGLSACEWGTPAKKESADVFTDTVSYSVKTIHERAPDCGEKADSACTVVKIKYMEFNNQVALNDTIRSKMLNLFTVYNRPDKSLQALTQTFIKAYIDFKKSEPKTKMFYTLDSHIKIVQQDSALIALEYGGYTFQGGAHGASFTGYINWNPIAEKEVILKDILVEGYEAELSKIAESIFRRNEKLTDTSSLKNDYFFTGDKFALNNNYSITPLGIKFLYNQYEIKPYAAGQTELFIPYAKIKTLIRPGSVVAQFNNSNAGI